ncbi:MAG TPA: Gfo/Idh/MocA family oxidoreductase [Candidatus Korarchaeota archaeon]|nr:Gfo/Idh/MocA family oxidoreductase [Candidatus Korarchaeota archaeon]
MTSIRTGIIGCGWFGEAHARVYREIPGVELRGVADLNIERSKRLASMYGASAYRSAEEMLRKEELDLVSIAVTPQYLAKTAMEVAEHDVNMLLEKPLATKMPEWRDLFSKVKRKGLIFVPGFIELFNPGYRLMKEVVDSGELGELLTLSSKRIGRFPKRSLKWEVGVTLDLGLHELYAQTYLVGENPVPISCFISKMLNSENEDISILILRYGSAVGIIESNWLTPIGVRNIRVTASEGSIWLNYMSQEVGVDKGEESRVKRPRWREPLLVELEYAVEHVRSGTKPKINEDFADIIMNTLFEALNTAKRIP